MSPSKEPGDPPPHWLIRSFGVVNLAFHRLTGGRLGLSRPKPDRWGTMCLTTTGRRTGRQRSAILGYYEDGPNLVALAVNAWAAAEPAWWLNLQAHPDARVAPVGAVARPGQPLRGDPHGRHRQAPDPTVARAGGRGAGASSSLTTLGHPLTEEATR